MVTALGQDSFHDLSLCADAGGRRARRTESLQLLRALRGGRHGGLQPVQVKAGATLQYETPGSWKKFPSPRR